MQNIRVLACENFFYPALAIFREIVMHHCNSYKWPHQKGGGGMCLKCPLLDPPLDTSIQVAIINC